MEGSKYSPPIKLCTTVILLVVKVPVLSEQMAVALPIVSHASKCRTKLLSCIIFCENTKQQIKLCYDDEFSCLSSLVSASYLFSGPKPFNLNRESKDIKTVIIYHWSRFINYYIIYAQNFSEDLGYTGASL